MWKRKRKFRKTSKDSYVVNIPSRYVSYLKLKEGEELELNLLEDAIVISRPLEVPVEEYLLDKIEGEENENGFRIDREEIFRTEC